MRRAEVARLFGEQRDDVAGADVPFVAQHVGNFAFEQEAVGEQFVMRHAGEAKIFDRMAERPVPQIVEQGGYDEQLGIGRGDGGAEASVVG